MDAAAGPSDPRISKAAQVRKEDALGQWMNALFRVRIRLARMPAGSRGQVTYEMSETLSENPFHMSDFRTSLEVKVSGSGAAIPATFLTDSLAAALSGDGRGETWKRPPEELHPIFLFQMRP